MNLNWIKVYAWVSHDMDNTATPTKTTEFSEPNVRTGKV